eukprot:TRINITY_DN4073_c0_g3_i2.p1 TRINITY_DN4073_c0_g3~~TRINITY_DN4073_c0_g3_i2.p1  ORF type:complete len:320 (-),score=-23.39 TRINITY_DN4073_c0_g3_i2:388-1347(-)
MFVNLSETLIWDFFKEKFVVLIHQYECKEVVQNRQVNSLNKYIVLLQVIRYTAKRISFNICFKLHLQFMYLFVQRIRLSPSRKKQSTQNQLEQIPCQHDIYIKNMYCIFYLVSKVILQKVHVRRFLLIQKYSIDNPNYVYKQLQIFSWQIEIFVGYMGFVGYVDIRVNFFLSVNITIYRFQFQCYLVVQIEILILVSIFFMQCDFNTAIQRNIISIFWLGYRFICLHREQLFSMCVQIKGIFICGISYAFDYLRVQKLFNRYYERLNYNVQVMRWYFYSFVKNIELCIRSQVRIIIISRQLVYLVSTNTGITLGSQIGN